MLTHAGRGYSAAFVANFEAVLARLSRGECVQLSDGPDDLCAPLCGEQGGAAHCYSDLISWRDAAASSALKAIPELAALFDEPGGTRIDRAMIAALRRRFATGLIRGACAGCEWSPFCSEIAASDYTKALL